MVNREEEQKQQQMQMEEKEKKPNNPNPSPSPNPQPENKTADENGGDEKKEEEPPNKDAPPPPPQEVVLKVFMHCDGCAKKVKRSLKGFPGVEDVITDSKTHKVVVKGEKAAAQGPHALRRLLSRHQETHSPDERGGERGDGSEELSGNSGRGTRPNQTANGQPSRPSSSIDQDRHLIRRYQAWKGRNVFCLQGRLIFGPDVSALPLSIFLIVAPATLFSVFVARKLMDDFHHWGVSIIVVEAILSVLVLATLVITSCRDPGIVPRNAKPSEHEKTADSILAETPHRQLPRFKEEVVNGIAVRIKYCETCKLYRPPRCSHCSVCDNCVERFDHHCPWVGQCIGLRNYRFYYMFVSSATALCVYIFSFSWIYITMIMRNDDISIWRSMSKTPVSVALIVYSFISVWFVGGLTSFHTYLISRNQSTYENFRYRFDRQVNPYDRGCYKNFKAIFCSSIPASKHNFREKVAKEAEVANMSTSFDRARPNVKKAGNG